MREALSGPMLAAMHAQHTSEVILPLIKMTQDGWEDPICIVPNTQPIVHQGDTYLPLGFDIALPDEEEDTIPVVAWRADNTDRRMVQAMRSVIGLVQARIVWVLASSPEHIEVGPYDVEMRSAKYDAQELSGTMGIEPVLDMPFGYMQFNPKNAPALF